MSRTAILTFLLAGCGGGELPGHYFSLVAKNLVFNGSYGRPLSSETVSLFDPTIGSGPGLIQEMTKRVWPCSTSQRIRLDFGCRSSR